MKKIFSASGFLFLAAFVSGFGGSAPVNPPPTVSTLDLDRYDGMWFEIARFEQTFQKGCVRSTAEYRVTSQSDTSAELSVLNRCTKESGGSSSAEAKAWVPDLSDPGKLRVRFFVFSSDYWILELGEGMREYSYTVVSNPKKSALWILSRTPGLPKETLDGILLRLRVMGFDTSKLVYDDWR